MIDLHTHSTASDGTCSPTELMALAYDRGLAAIALTDHDTLAGLAEAKKAAESHGIRFIRGLELEISTEASGFRLPGEFHLLGLDLGEDSDELNESLARVKEQRNDRNLAMLERVRNAGIDANFGELEELALGGGIGRPHFARLLVKKGVVKNVALAFKRFLGKGKPFYLPRKSLGLPEAISAIKSVGGRIVVAHPLSLFLSWGRLLPFLSVLKERGVEGIEAWHPVARVVECQRLEAFANREGFFITGGSDYHGAMHKERKLGLSAGGRKIDDSYLEAFRKDE